MLLRNHRGTVTAVRGNRRGFSSTAPFTDTNPLRFRLLSAQATSGVTVGPDQTFGIPTLVECVRMPAQLLATLDWWTWDWSNPSVPQRNTTAWQWGLFQNPGFGSTFDLIQDISASVDGWANAYIQKIKATKSSPKTKTSPAIAKGQVVALKVIDPDQVKVKLKDGQKVFDVTVYNNTGGRTSKTITLGTDEILHIRGFANRGFLAGMLPFDQFRNSFGNVLAVESFSANWWKNSGTVSTIITHPDKLNPTQADQILDIFDENHTGLDNSGKPALLSGGAKLEVAKITAEDAQLTPSREWGVEEIARAMDWPVELLTSSGDKQKTEEIMLKAKMFYLMPRFRRIRDAFNTDPDLFQGFPVWLDARFDSLEAADSNNRSNAELRRRQAGILTANEIRVPLGYPPRSDGNVLQAIPVGGGANPTATPEDDGSGDKK